MRRSWLALVFGLSLFALMGAECDTGGNIEDDKGPLPPRALAATPLLRTYYQTQHIPKNMRAIKIPEGDAFDPDELTLLFDMSGDERVFDVRLRVTVGKPLLIEGQDPDLFARIIAPDGTTSAWKEVPLASGTSYRFVPEITFLYEFDDIFSTGVWKVQLRDPIKDNDGRCLFRNATLRINNGEVSSLVGQPQDNETVLLTAATGKFGQIPEVKGGGFSGDFGVYGVENMLINKFTFTQSFSVQFLVVDLVVLPQFTGGNVANDLALLIIAPSGGYFMLPLTDEIDDFDVTTERKMLYFHYVFGATQVGEGFAFYGEPSQGTWYACLVDLTADGIVYDLMSDVADLEIPEDPGPPIIPAVPAPQGIQLTLIGSTYP